MTGPAGAFLLAGLQVLIGTFAVMWSNLLVYRVVDRGHYRSATWVLFPLILGIAFLLPEDVLFHSLATALLAALFLAAIYSQRPGLEWSSGALASLLGAWLIVASTTNSCTANCGMTAIHALGGAFLLGALTHAMVLGHWYLNQPRLPMEPLRGATRLLLGSAFLMAGLGVATRSFLVQGAAPGSVIAFSSAGYWWTWLLLMAGVGVLGGMVSSTVRSRSTQSATGLLYVAIIPALVAQFVLNLLALP